MFTASNLQERIRQRPFVPFRIITSAGDQYDVHNPDLVMVGKDLLVVGTPTSRDSTIFKNTKQVFLAQIVAIE